MEKNTVKLSNISTKHSIVFHPFFICISIIEYISATTQLCFSSFAFVFLRSGCDVGGVSGTIGFTVGQKIRQKSGNCGDTLVYNGILGSNTFFQTWIGRKLKTLKIDEKVDLKLQQQKKVKMQKKTHYFRTIFLWQHCLVSCSLFTTYIYTFCLFTYIYEKYQQKNMIGNFHRVNF